MRGAGVRVDRDASGPLQGGRRADLPRLAAEPAVPWTGLRTFREHSPEVGEYVSRGRGTAHKQLVVEKAGVTFTPRRMPSPTAS